MERAKRDECIARAIEKGKTGSMKEGSQQPTFCDRHPSETLFEALTPDWSRIRLTCLACEAENRLPERIKSHANRVAKEKPSEADVAIGALVMALLGAFFGGYGTEVLGLGSGVLGLGYALGALVGATAGLYLIRRSYDVKQGMPTLESVRRELEGWPTQAAKTVESFKARVRQQYTSDASGIREVDNMSGRHFEEFMADVLRRRGLRVQLTPGSGDLGVDLVVETDTEKTAVQCKRRQSSEAIGPAAIQQVYTGKPLLGCSKALIITNARFTQQAQRMAKELGVEMWDRDALIAMLSKTQTRISWEEYLRGYYAGEARAEDRK